MKAWLSSAILVATLVAAGSAHAASRNVRILSTPKGAAVYVDEVKGKPIGVTPIRRARITYGYHELIFVLEGYETKKVPVNVGRKTYKVTAELAQMAKVMVSAGSTSSRGADVIIDGKPMGKVPWSGFVPPGRHRISIEREGYAPFGDWVELAAGQILTLPAVLAEAKKKGTIFVTADVPVAAVFVDGRPVGEVPALVEVPAGKAVVEVHGGDGLVWRKTVEVKAGDKSIVEARLVGDSGPTGTALVLSNVADTLVWIDGVKTGTAPVTKRNLAVGAHIVEGKADGYAPAQTTVRVNPNEQSVVKLEMKAAEAEYGRISVRAAVPGAEVFIDGGKQGPAPVELDKVALGPHAITVRAPGHADFEASCEVKRNQTCSVMARQLPLARIRVTSNADNAQLFIDGDRVGPVPYEGSLSAEGHTLKVEAPHHHAKEMRLTFEVSTEVRELSFDLASTGTSPAAIAQRKAAANEAKLARNHAATHVTGLPPAPGKTRLHFSLGVPYLLEAGGSVGLIENLAVQVRFRVLQRDSTLGSADLMLGAHYGFRPLQPLSFGVQALGWAGSSMEREGAATSFGGNVRGIATLHFAERAQFSLSLMGQFSYDSWDAVEDDYISGSDSRFRCQGKTSQGAARLLAGGSFVVWLNDRVGAFGNVDWAAVGPERCYFQQAVFNALNEDPFVYMNAGVIVGL